MTAAAERIRLAAIGHDLARLGGDRGWRRGQILLGVARTDPTVGFADLARAPGWLRRAPGDLTALASWVALIAMAPALAASIDGDWLGDLAKRAGAPALDHAISLADQIPGGGTGAVPAETIEGLGFDLMRAALPVPLRPYLAWAGSANAVVARRLADFCCSEAAKA